MFIDTSSLWVREGVSATLQSDRYTLSYPRGRHIFDQCANEADKLKKHDKKRINTAASLTYTCYITMIIIWSTVLWSINNIIIYQNSHENYACMLIKCVYKRYAFAICGYYIHIIWLFISNILYYNSYFTVKHGKCIHACHPCMHGYI